MEDETITNEQIYASSYFSNYDPWQARLGNTRSWITETQNPSSPWIQVQLQNIVVITGIQTQGGGYMNPYWVETLHVKYEDYQVWCYIMDGEKEMVCISFLE